MPKIGTLINAAAALLIFVVAGIALTWSTWGRYKVGCDLEDYARATRQSFLPLNDKQRLLGQIEVMEDRLDGGGTVELHYWRRSDRAVRDMIRTGITSESALLIERELRRVESRFAEAEGESGGRSARRP